MARQGVVGSGFGSHSRFVAGANFHSRRKQTTCRWSYVDLRERRRMKGQVWHRRLSLHQPLVARNAFDATQQTI
jgi:hypothetical protein